MLGAGSIVSTGAIVFAGTEVGERVILGVSVPLISVDAQTASAASKVALALDRLGLKF